MPRVVFKQTGTIPASGMDAAMRARQEAFNRTTDALAESLRSGRITLGMYEEDMRTRLRQYLGGMAIIGKGGVDNMTPSDWGKVGAELKKQYKWLHGFVKDIYSNRETVTVEAIKARARLYGEAGPKMAIMIQAGDLADPKEYLPWLPRDGSTECLNRCLCRWILTTIPSGDVNSVTAVWTLSPAEHCDTCLERDGYIASFTVPLNVDVPDSIGFGG